MITGNKVKGMEHQVVLPEKAVAWPRAQVCSPHAPRAQTFQQFPTLPKHVWQCAADRESKTQTGGRMRHRQEGRDNQSARARERETEELGDERGWFMNERVVYQRGSY